MGRSTRRRAHKRQRRFLADAQQSLQIDGVSPIREDGTREGLLLEAWRRTALWRAKHFKDAQGQPARPVWDLFRQKAEEAAAYNMVHDLRRVCAEAIAGQVNPQMAKLADRRHLMQKPKGG